MVLFNVKYFGIDLVSGGKVSQVTSRHRLGICGTKAVGFFTKSEQGNERMPNHFTVYFLMAFFGCCRFDYNLSFFVRVFVLLSDCFIVLFAFAVVLVRVISPKN